MQNTTFQHFSLPTFKLKQMKQIKIFLLPLPLFLLPLFSPAQDIHFSQMTETPILQRLRSGMM